MKILLAILFLLVTVSQGQAQGSGAPPARPAADASDTSGDSDGPHFYPAFSRKGLSIPPYGREKVETLIRAAQIRDSVRHSFVTAISPEEYASLSLREKFTYNMIQPESYNQSCYSFPIFPKTEIPAQLPKPFDAFSWSQRQRQFFIDNRDSVITFIKEGSKGNAHTGLNDKAVIVLVNATELIPFLRSSYRKEKDPNILTVLMLLMVYNKYEPFRDQDLYKKLYEGKKSSYRASIDLTPARERLILRLAANFYNGLHQ